MNDDYYHLDLDYYHHYQHYYYELVCLRKQKKYKNIVWFFPYEHFTIIIIDDEKVKIK